MKQYMFAALAAVPCIVSVASAATVEEYEALINKQFAYAKKSCAVMESIKDKESADAAAEKLVKLSKKAKKLEKQAKAMGEPTAEQTKELQAKMEARKDEIMAMVMQAFNQMMRLQMEDCYGSDALKNTLETMAKTQSGVQINVSDGAIDVKPSPPEAPASPETPAAPETQEEK